jgi:hypothetical protein
MSGSFLERGFGKMIVLCDGENRVGDRPGLTGNVVRGLVLFPSDFKDFQGLVEYLEMCRWVRFDGKDGSEFERSVRDALGGSF